MRKSLQPVKLGEGTEPTSEKTNMNDIFAGDDEEEVEQDGEEVGTNQLTPEKNDS